jgi:hypothetical protein
MAISINTTPNNYEPVYTYSMPFIISSTFQAEENFKYLFDLYLDGVFKNRIATYPRPGGLGLYSPHLVLQSNTNTIIGPSSLTIKENPNSEVSYFFNFGEQYNPNLSFVDTDLSTSFTGYTFSTNISSEFFIGDIITVQKDNISINPWINGTASITALTSNFSIMTDKPRDPSVVFSSNETGTIINITRLSATSSDYIGWNAARQEDEFNINFQDVYVMEEDSFNNYLSSYETSYLSNLTQEKPIYLNTYETLDLITATGCFATFSDLFSVYEYFDSSGTILGTDILQATPDPGVIRFVIPSGTANIVGIGLSGSSFISNGTLDTYRVTMYIGNGTISSEISDTFIYKITPNCRPYDVINLAFLNKQGGFDYWSFNLVSKYTSNITRTQINRARSLLTTQSIERGRDIIYSKAVENWTINSDGLTDSDALFVRELVESSDVYIVNSDGSVDPIVITSDNWEFKSGLLNGYVQYTINFIKAYDVIINR